jgi:hypothetical protein
MKKYSDEENLKRFNKDTENAWKNYHKNKSEEAKKEKQKKLDDWRKAMGDSTWYPVPVKLEITEIESESWNFKKFIELIGWHFSWKKLKEYGIKKTISNFKFGIELSKNQKIQYKQRIKIIGFDTSDKPQDITITLRSREYFKKLFTRKDKIYFYKVVNTGELGVKKAKNLHDLYHKIGFSTKIKSLGWISIEELNKMKKQLRS